MSQEREARQNLAKYRNRATVLSEIADAQYLNPVAYRFARNLAIEAENAANYLAYLLGDIEVYVTIPRETPSGK